MSDVTIYDSSGHVRYPEGSGDRSQADVERLRDRLFQSIHLEYDPSDGSVYAFFKASTGTPEQFVGRYRSDGDGDVLAEAHQAISGVADELDWRLSDTETSEGHQLFTELPSVSAEPPERYDTTVIERLLSDGTVDFAAPDGRSAIAVMKHFIDAYDGERGAAIAAEGRSDFVSDVDIVITPSGSDSRVRGIDGTHDRFVADYTESKAETVIDRMTDARDAIRTDGHDDFSDRVTTSLDRAPIDIGRYGYVAKTTDALSARRRRDTARVGAVVGAIALVASLWYAGAVETITAWFDAEIRSTSVELVFASVPMIDPPSATLLLSVSVVLAAGWILAGAVVARRVISLSSDSDGGRRDGDSGRRNGEHDGGRGADTAGHSDGGHGGDNGGYSGGTTSRLPSEYEEAIAAAFDDVNRSPFAETADLMEALTRKINASDSAGFVLRKRGSDPIKRLIPIAGAAVFSGATAGIVGWLAGSFVLEPLLGVWLYLAIALLFGTGVAVVVAGAVALRDPIVSVAQRIPPVAVLAVALLSGTAAILYGVYRLAGLYPAVGGGTVVFLAALGGIAYLRRRDTGPIRKETRPPASPGSAGEGDDRPVEADVDAETTVVDESSSSGEHDPRGQNHASEQPTGRERRDDHASRGAGTGGRGPNSPTNERRNNPAGRSSSRESTTAGRSGSSGAGQGVSARARSESKPMDSKYNSNRSRSGGLGLLRPRNILLLVLAALTTVAGAWWLDLLSF